MINASTIRKHFSMMMDHLLPPRCLLCGMASDFTCLCVHCKLDLPWLGHQCRHCGLPLTLDSDRHCGACITRPPPYTRTIAPLQYDFPADRLVQSLKFKRQLVAGRILARLLAEAVTSGQFKLPDMLIPVPIHGLRLTMRGFNQAYELASYVGATLGIQVDCQALRKIRHTPAQSGLSSRQRRKNIRNAFYWHGLQKPARHIALIDDVMTTGSTMMECTRVLKRAGSKRVDAWVATRAVGSANY